MHNLFTYLSKGYVTGRKRKSKVIFPYNAYKTIEKTYKNFTF